ncbi:MAG: hypothetical protein Q8N03_12410 [Ignavibacteria bacterium]|nr:hypothetical protein [Ignavibacteria bacterium]
MKFEVNNSGSDLIINIEIPDKYKEKLLEEFSNCQQGKCSCPTEEYKKLESLTVETDENKVSLTLKSRLGQSIDISEINKCLNYTSNKIEEDR